MQDYLEKTAYSHSHSVGRYVDCVKLNVKKGRVEQYNRKMPIFLKIIFYALQCIRNQARLYF